MYYDCRTEEYHTPLTDVRGVREDTEEANRGTNADLL